MRYVSLVIAGILAFAMTFQVEAKAFKEVNGLVIMEAESVPMDGDWVIQKKIANYSGTGYVMANTNGVLKYEITFTNTGTYHFNWRNSAPHQTEHNDSHIRIVGPNATIKSESNAACTEKVNRVTWVKVFANPKTSQYNQWIWQARNCDHTKNRVFIQVNTPGVYTLEVKQRSDKHKIDRIVLNDLSKVSDSEAQNLSKSETVNDGSDPTDPPPPPPPGDETTVTMQAVDFANKGNFYVDQSKWLGIEPGSSPVSATATDNFSGTAGSYTITFHAVGENDGRSSFELYVGGDLVGSFQPPLSTDLFEEGAAYNYTWTNVSVSANDEIKVVGTTASEDTEWARARWSKIVFVLDDATQSITRPVSAKPQVLGITSRDMMYGIDGRVIGNASRAKTLGRGIYIHRNGAGAMKIRSEITR